MDDHARTQEALADLAAETRRQLQLAADELGQWITGDKTGNRAALNNAALAHSRAGDRLRLLEHHQAATDPPKPAAPDGA